jgi:hypothetical protein
VNTSRDLKLTVRATAVLCALRFEPLPHTAIRVAIGDGAVPYSQTCDLIDSLAAPAVPHLDGRSALSPMIEELDGRYYLTDLAVAWLELQGASVAQRSRARVAKSLKEAARHRAAHPCPGRDRGPRQK